MSDIKESFIGRYRILREEKESMAARYIKKASADWAERERDYGREQESGLRSDTNDERKRWNREAGISKAVKRLTRNKK